ncbi:restriction endonuclease subunit S [Campylobacter hyointestinalis]|uniref:restriction endonuclease subunit S n=1 Tax=Campylobacter hyointestinalis TaxID=198 RepID=UPI0021589D1A|nr:restriction endonuclease subunit S [Campylobacter hyointestinalis]
MKWSEFRIGDLFEQYRGKEKAPNQCKDGNIPLINEISTNNGLSKYATPTKVFTRNAITISINYATTVFYQSMDFCASVNISILKNDKILNKKRALFIISQLRKINQKYNYAQKISKDKINDTKIQLPITQNGEIDFDFMESFIAELEAERVRELEAYLKASGLSDTTLSPDEKSALNTWNSRIWQEFRIGDLFEIKTPKKRFDANKIKFGGLYPYVVRTSINNGIRGYITENTDFLNEKNTISFGQDTATMFYQKSEYFTGDKIKVFKLKDYELNSKIANFLISVMTKAFSNFSWGSSSFNVKVLNEVKILLPLNKNGEIDFDFMESFISGVQKTSIKGVIELKDKIIEQTKKAI